MKFCYYLCLFAWCVMGFGGRAAFPLFFVILFISFVGVFRSFFVKQNMPRSYDYTYFLRWFCLFLFLGIIYAGFSFFNLAEFWNVPNLHFDSSYIYRHSIIVFQFVIPLFIAQTVAENTLDSMFKINTKLLLCILLLLLLPIGTIGVRFPQINLLASLYVVLHKKKWLIALIPLIQLHLWGSSVSFAIGTVALIIVLVYPLIASKPFNKYFTKAILIIVLLAVSFPFVFTETFADLIASDLNAVWRYNIWTNEIQSLSQTYFTGVGFGTAYLTTDIWDKLFSVSIHEFYDDIFVVANHNSFINYFYRMGIAGGVVFIMLNFALIRWFIKTYKKTMRKREYVFYSNLLLWAFANYAYSTVIIAFNPGLESPRYSLGFLFSFGFLLGLLLKFDRNIYYIRLNKQKETKYENPPNPHILHN